MNDTEDLFVSKLGKRSPQDISAFVKKIVSQGVDHWEKEAIAAHELARKAPETEREEYMKLYYEAFRHWHRLRQTELALESESASKALRGELARENA